MNFFISCCGGRRSKIEPTGDPTADKSDTLKVNTIEITSNKNKKLNTSHSERRGNGRKNKTRLNHNSNDQAEDSFSSTKENPTDRALSQIQLLVDPSTNDENDNKQDHTIGKIKPQESRSMNSGFSNVRPFSRRTSNASTLVETIALTGYENQKDSNLGPDSSGQGRCFKENNEGNNSLDNISNESMNKEIEMDKYQNKKESEDRRNRMELSKIKEKETDISMKNSEESKANTDKDLGESSDKDNFIRSFSRKASLAQLSDKVGTLLNETHKAVKTLIDDIIVDENEKTEKQIKEEMDIMRLSQTLSSKGKISTSIPLNESDMEILEYLLRERISAEKWERRVSKDYFSLWLKKESKYHQSAPFVKAEFTFDSHGLLSTSNILDLLYDPPTRKSWDTSLKEYKTLKEEDNYTYYYMVSKIPGPFSDRDFVEKRIRFYCKDIEEEVVIYSAAPDEIFPKPKGVERSYTIVGANFVSLISDEKGKSKAVKVWSMSQIDAKTNIPAFLLTTALPNTYEKWYQNVKTTLKKKFVD